MRKKLTLSVIIPVYNDENHLRACLKSVVAQTIKPSEVIVVNNNSTDGSMKIVKDFPFVKVVHEEKQGVVFARDRGFNAAKSVIIGRIDSDTVLPQDWTERILKFYESSDRNEAAITGGCNFYNIRLPRLTSRFQGQVAFRWNRLLMGHYILFGSNMAFTKKQWQEVSRQVCDDTDVHEDLGLVLHLHKLGYQINYDESLKVGVAMKRVRSNRKALWKNLMLWPKTLRRHGMKTWVFGYIGAVLFFMLSPLARVAETIARFFGRKPLKD